MTPNIEEGLHVHKNCITCNSSTLIYLVNFKHDELVRCSGCGLVFDRRVPTDSELATYYSTYSYSERKAVPYATMVSYEKLLDYFEGYRDTNNLLDISCGQGDFLLAAKARGWNIYGSEYSPAAVELCQKEDITMHHGALESGVFSDVSFDIVTAFEVLEHTNAPNTFIKNAIQSLRLGGGLYLTVPSYNALLRHFERENFYVLAYPEHLAFYSPKSIIKLLRAFDLNRIYVKTTGIDLVRLKRVFLRDRPSPETINRSEAVQETGKLRANLAKGKGSIIKDIVNFVLTIFGVGDTLKIFYVKR